MQKKAESVNVQKFRVITAYFLQKLRVITAYCLHLKHSQTRHDTAFLSNKVACMFINMVMNEKTVVFFY